MTEQVLQKKIIEVIEKEYNGYVVKVQVASKSGVPDLLCCINGMFIGIEVKRPESKNNVSKLQLYNIKQIGLAGGKSEVIYNLEYLREWLDDIIGDN